MPIFNYAAREITCKIVYYGPGRSGKTSSLQAIYAKVPAARRGTMYSLATQGDLTLFFDYLPLELGRISGYLTRFQLYTVPGQPQYAQTRRLVLHGADGIVFVADSQLARMEENLDSLRDMHEALLMHGVDPRNVPLVFHYNKQDLPEPLVARPEELDVILNFRGMPSFPGDALRGRGVFEALRAVSVQVLRRFAEPARARI